MKILFWDLENVQESKNIFHPGNYYKKRAAGFCANLAYILNFGYKWHGAAGGVLLPHADEFQTVPHNIDTIDKALVTTALEIIEQADLIVTWYGSGHDVKFLAARAAYHGLVYPYKVPHIDLYRVASRVFPFSTNRMDAVATFFKLENKIQVDKTLWPRCWFGDKQALTDMSDYCYQDVVVLEQLYDRMLPHIPNHPRVGQVADLKTCPSCGSTSTQSKGIRTTRQRAYVRRACNGCGASFVGETIKEGK